MPFCTSIHCMDGRIQRLDLPYKLKEDAEELSDLIGPKYTPQEALEILQGMIQDHPTTLVTRAKES